MIPTIFVVTPCLNTRETLDRTILSVVTQAGDFKIRYHIQDGGSTDGNYERILWWKRQLTTKGFPLLCRGLDFSCAQENDAGMYDAIIRGYDKMDIAFGDFMTWINADDILMPGSLAFISNVRRQFESGQVSWLGGTAYLVRDNSTIVAYDRFIPTEAIREGLCDSQNWDFVQQEGTFYRKWLWDTVDPAKTIRTMKVAGDWNLWRLMAHHASLVQAPFPTGCFSVRAGQLSGKFRTTYHNEMDAAVSPSKRRESLALMGQRGYVTRRRFNIRYSDSQLSIVEEHRNQKLVDNYKKVFGKDIPTKFEGSPDKVLHVGNISYQNISAIPKAAEFVKFEENIVSYDRDWQAPAITEKHSFERIRQLCSIPKGITYVAYPWATLIDKLQFNASDAYTHYERFLEFAELVPKDTINVTVCQQILMKRHIPLLEKCGISHVFWPHATHRDLQNTTSEPFDLAIYPFPLFPVQVPTELDSAKPDTDLLARRYLFSFIGARTDRWYLTKTRDWILNNLAQDARGLVVGRDGWFYNKAVYDTQVFAKNGVRTESLPVDQGAAEEFRTILEQSTFSLCPSGTGPNTIRLWESLGAGAIPVILSDTWAPPGNLKLWQAAAVFWPETQDSVKALPDRLEEIARDPTKLAAMRQAGRQLWLLYGPGGFVTDIQKLMLELASAPKQKHGSDLLVRMVTSLGHEWQFERRDAIVLLRSTATRLMLDGSAMLKAVEQHKPLGQMIALAREKLLSNDTAVVHFDRVLSHVQKQSEQARRTAPYIGHNASPKICLFGRHSNRTPLSYDPIVRLTADRLDFVANPVDADLIVTGFCFDLRDGAKELAEVKKTNPSAKILVLSEEPLWDTLWSGGFVERHRTLEAHGVSIDYNFINHENSRIFDFANLPYFPLTSDDYVSLYANLLSRFADLTPAELLKKWDEAPLRAAFYAEHRIGKTYEWADPSLDSWGLCVYRTEVAKASGNDRVIRSGKGWYDEKRRQDLPDWHLDKLATLDQRTRVMSSFENTHQRHYVSEKIFDAFATGSIPSYFASPKHRVFELIPEAAMINTFGLEAKDAAQKIMLFKPDTTFAEAWLATARSLRSLFSNLSVILNERRRIADETLREVEAIL